MGDRESAARKEKKRDELEWWTRRGKTRESRLEDRTREGDLKGRVQDTKSEGERGRVQDRKSEGERGRVQDRKSEGERR